MSGVGITLSMAGLPRFQAILNELGSSGKKAELGAALRREAERCRQDLAASSPVAPRSTFDGGKMRQPGGLRNSWRVRLIENSTSSTASIFTSAFYAQMVEGGTASHLISPQRKSGKKALKFVLGGARFAKVIKHPGSRAQHFIAAALARSEARMGNQVALEVANIYVGAA